MSDPQLRPDGEGGSDDAPASAKLQPAPAPRRASARPSALEWLLLRRSLREARAALDEDPERDRAVDRAEAAAELGDRAREGVDPPRRGSGLPLAISLYREAAYWALVACERGRGLAGDARDLADAFERAPPELLAAAAGGATAAAAAREALVGRTFVDTAGEAPERLAREAEHAAGFVRALIDAAAARRRRVTSLLLQRFVRTFTLVASLALLAFAAVSGARRMFEGPDLAAGKPWRASSTYKTSDGSTQLRDLTGAPLNILFHTNEEASPWFEIDLGAPTRVSSVKVRNRLDCCQERATPLVVETSNDRAAWKQVARTQDSFTTLKLPFAPQDARYVRLRVDRFSTLHLAKVEVRLGRPEGEGGERSKGAGATGGGAPPSRRAARRENSTLISAETSVVDAAHATPEATMGAFGSPLAATTAKGRSNLTAMRSRVPMPWGVSGSVEISKMTGM